MIRRIGAALSVVIIATLSLHALSSPQVSMTQVAGKKVAASLAVNGNGNRYGQLIARNPRAAHQNRPATTAAPPVAQAPPSTAVVVTTSPPTTAPVITAAPATAPPTTTPTTVAPVAAPAATLPPTTAAPAITAAPTTTASGPYVVINPGQSVQDAINSHPGGTAFLLKAGTHSGRHLSPKNGQSFIGEEGAILSGGDRLDIAFVGDASNVVIDNLIIEKYANPAQVGAIHATGPGWVIRNSEFRYNAGAGLSFRSGWRVTGNYIHHNKQIGLIGFQAVNTLIEGNEISFNNWTDAYDPVWEAGGSKFVATQNLVVRNNYVHNNHGPGLWTDIDNINTLYEGNVTINNHGPGIEHEISFAAVIRNNRVEGNGHHFYTGGILITESSNVEVYGNSLAGNDGGIVAIQDNRTPGSQGPYRLENLNVHSNTVSYQVGWTGLRDNIGDGAVYGWNNRFESNNYVVPSSHRGWYWRGELVWSQWTALGHDS